MKKIILLPKTDTVIICLPPEWIGCPVVCKLEPIKASFMKRDEVEMEVERMIVFRNRKKKKKK
jgi:hypothetical protein